MDEINKLSEDGRFGEQLNSSACDGGVISLPDSRGLKAEMTDAGEYELDESELKKAAGGHRLAGIWSGRDSKLISIYVSRNKIVFPAERSKAALSL